MAKFLFVSEQALAVDLAWQLVKEGHQVRFYIEWKGERNVGDGLFEKVDDWQAHKDWADVIVFDDSEFGPTVERLRREGKPVIGGPTYTDRLEANREFGQREMKEAGLNVLPYWEFHSFDEAIKFVRENKDRYVVKPSGGAQNEKVLSYVGQDDDGSDVITVLEMYKRGWANKIRSFQIQKFVQGVEVAIGAFFNGKDFILPACVNFEHKRLFNDEIGPSTGEMGTLMFWSGENTLYRETLARMKTRLAECGYVGYFDINCIANARAIYPLEVTPRFGYPTINIQMEGVLSPWGEFLEALARGQPYNLRTKKGFQIGVVVAVPPFPFEDPGAFKKYSEDAPILFKKPLTEGLHPCDVKVVDGQWLLAGRSGYALVVTGSGSTVADARRECYNRVRNIMIPNMFYRTDIGERWTRDSDLLQTWGYLT